MTQEEKAKAYDEAIRNLRGMMPNWDRLSYNGKTFLQDLIYIFPELKEREGKRIRKELIEYFEHYSGGDNISIKFPEWIAWLKKQGEKKPTWSKKDDETVTGIINDIQERLEDYPTEQLADIYFKEIKWLKSIKERIGG